jgi:chromosome segregation ATPase
MNTSFMDRLDETTRQYVREALADTDTDTAVREQLAGVTKQAAEVAQEVEAGASPDDALAFTREFENFLSVSKAKALEAERIEAEIETKRAEVAETQAEIQHRSASLSALAAAVNRTLDKCEEARYEYSAQEFQIATLSTRLSMRRAELADLRRQLAQLKTQEVQQ